MCQIDPQINSRSFYKPSSVTQIPSRIDQIDNLSQLERQYTAKSALEQEKNADIEQLVKDFFLAKSDQHPSKFNDIVEKLDFENKKL